MASHKTYFIEFGYNAAHVDRGIADLILSLWKLNIDTCNSCENNVPKGFVWIEFPTARDAEAFLDIVANPYEDDYDSFYQHIMRYWRPLDHKHEERLRKTDWIYDIYPQDDINVESDDEGDSISISRPGRACIIFNVSIRFPRKHLPMVMERINEQLMNSARSLADVLSA